MEDGSDVLGWGDSSTALHEDRLDAVTACVSVDRVETVLDLGCGSGALLERLITLPRLRRIVGVDASARALLSAEERLAAAGGKDARVELRQGSVLTVDEDLAGFDAAVLLETIEHLDPAHLSRLEQSLFARLSPGRVVITTPNREYNPLYGLAPGELRHPHHRFEWDRAKFRAWVTGAAGRNGYSVSVQGVGPANRWYGSSTQMAVFDRGAGRMSGGQQ